MFCFQAEDGIRDVAVTGVQTCALPIYRPRPPRLDVQGGPGRNRGSAEVGDRKSTRLNSSHGYISYAVFCFKKKRNVAGRGNRGAGPDASGGCRADAGDRYLRRPSCSFSAFFLSAAARLTSSFPPHRSLSIL